MVCFSSTGSFGRRASDGGANLQIYYTTSASSGQSVEPIYVNPANVKDLRIGVDAMQQQHSDNMSVTIEGNDEQNDEIQRLIDITHNVVVFLFATFKATIH